MRYATITLPGRCAAIGSALLLTLALAVSGFASPSNKTYTKYVGPPNGFDDTGVLQDALNDCAINHASGCTIRLSSGTYVSKPLAVSNFHGSLIGMGMDVTTIAAFTPLADVWPTLLTFTDGDITVSDMSFQVTAYQPVDPCDPVASGGFCGVYSLVLVTGYNSTNASFQRVAFDGGPGPEWFGAYNLYAGLLYEGVDVGNQNFTGTFKMSGCRITNSSENLRVYGTAEAQVTIGGSLKSGNVFENGVISLAIFDTAHSVIQITDNDVTNPAAYGAAVDLLQSSDYAHDPSLFNVWHNTISVSGDSNTGIAVNDLTHFFLGSPASTVSVSNNTITLQTSQDGTPYDGINLYVGQENFIFNNKISGPGFYGIAAWAVDRCMLIANNFRNVQASIADIGLMTDTPLGAPVPTTNCTVVATSRKDTICDQGVGNLIIGGTVSHCTPPASTVKETMKRKAAAQHDARAFAKPMHH